jgi:chloramphenicol O-acetyltransferase type A
MKTYLDIGQWSRKEHFHFFKTFDEPFFGATVAVDCTRAYDNAKLRGSSFFIWYLYKTLVAVNATEPFRYRIEDDRIAVYDTIDASPTIGRQDGSFGFALVPFDPDFDKFSKNAVSEIERIQLTSGLFTRTFDANLIHFSALPWLSFTSLSHARHFSLPDSCPKISFGKMTLRNGCRTMPMSVHVHHALMDGVHLAAFIDRFQLEMDR